MSSSWYEEIFGNAHGFGQPSEEKTFELPIDDPLFGFEKSSGSANELCKQLVDADLIEAITGLPASRHVNREIRLQKRRQDRTDRIRAIVERTRMSEPFFKVRHDPRWSALVDHCVQVVEAAL